jgi:hypothetical protein
MGSNSMFSGVTRQMPLPSWLLPGDAPHRVFLDVLKSPSIQLEGEARTNQILADP